MTEATAIIVNTKKFFDHQYQYHKKQHVDQNRRISRDFLNAVATKEKFNQRFLGAKKILEVGCGTGNLCRQLVKNYPQIERMAGIDISDVAIDICRSEFEEDVYQFVTYDCSLYGGFKPLGTYDITICSNTLEHFWNPWEMIDWMLEISKVCCIIVPYKQNLEHVGQDATHVFSFDLPVFDKYDIIDWFTFKTDGWRKIDHNPDPKQLAILLQ